MRRIMNIGGNLFFLVVAHIVMSACLVLACSLFPMSCDNFSYCLFSRAAPFEFDPFLASPLLAHC